MFTPAALSALISSIPPDQPFTLLVGEKLYLKYFAPSTATLVRRSNFPHRLVLTGKSLLQKRRDL